MGLYYNINTYELKNIDDNLYNEWISNNNPKSSIYISAPTKPSNNAIWNDGNWIEPDIAIPFTISARQIRLWLIRNNIDLSAIDSAINNIPDAQLRDSVRVEWEYAPYIERNHPMLVPLAASLGLSENDIDRAFLEASNI